MNKITFSEAVRNKIDKECRDKAFIFSDFTDIADAYGKPPKAITHVLRDMYAMGFLNVVGKTKKPGGGSPSNIYRVIHGIRIEVKPPKAKKFQREEHIKKLENREIYATQCAMRISKALDNMENMRINI